VTSTQGTRVDHSRSNNLLGVLNADLALLLCARGWGFPESTSQAASSWQRLAPDWRQRLQKPAIVCHSLAPSDALDQLRRSHRHQCRANPGQVHPSWWIRALESESPAVRRLIALHGPPQLRPAAATAPGIGTEGAQGSLDPNPEALHWVLALWTERLVGGEPLQEDEHPVILALAGLSGRGLYRLSFGIALAKVVLAGDPDDIQGRRAAWRARGAWYMDWFLQRIGPADKQPRSWASLDIKNAPGRPSNSDRRRLATLGLISLARHLVGQEPHRVRWALQHLPYPIAKYMRSNMALDSQPSAKLLLLETMLLQAAWERLAQEQHLTLRYPDDMSCGRNARDVN
jgi:hypothetical protein